MHESIILNMKLSTLNTLACIFSAMTILSAILMTVAVRIGLKKSHITSETKNLRIDKFSINKKWRKIGMTFRLIMILSFIASMFFILYYSTLNKKALDAGAYNNMQKTQKISEIKKHLRYGFKESKNLPDDLKGQIVIVFRYGCMDCDKIHDELFEYIDKNNIENIYFVSSESDQGKNIIYPYGEGNTCLIEKVPSIIYFSNHPQEEYDNYNQPLYSYDIDGRIYCVTDAIDLCLNLREEGI